MRASRLAVTVAALAAVLAVTLPSHAATQNVLVIGFQFAPGGFVTVDPLNAAGGAGTVGSTDAALTYARGDTITWTSADALPHSVVKVSGPWPTSFTTRQLPGPGSASSLNTSGYPAGTYVYVCGIHPGMRGAFKLA